MSANPVSWAAELSLVFIIGVMGVLLCLIPRLTRPDIYFAVTVPPSFRDTEEGARILRDYRVAVVVHSLLAVVLVLFGFRMGSASWLPLVGIFWPIIGSFSAYFRARRGVLPHAVAPSTIREADLTPRPVRLPGGWILQVGPFAILGYAALWLHLHWQEIPERFPVHWGLDGKPNRWATRSVSGVYGPLFLGAALCAGLAVLTYGTLRWTRRVQGSGGPGQSELRFRKTVVSVILATEYFLSWVFSWTGWLALHSQQKLPDPIALLVMSLAFLVLVIVVLIYTGQGGSRLPEFSSLPPEQLGRPPVGDRTLDRYWKAGVFYFNPDDPVIMVEKRFGLGYTLNFGQPISWVIIAALLLVPFIIIYLIRTQLPR
jgi:uncharacterized membrane protein